MKTFLNLLACVIVLAVAACLGSALGFFKLPALDSAQKYGMSYVSWAKGGFKGSPTASLMATTEQPEAAAPTQAQTEQAQLVNESKRRAVARYPDLAVANTEMNSRFVFRYKKLVEQKSARLEDATWPETLAEECAVASKVHAKSGPLTENSKKLVATTAQ